MRKYFVGCLVGFVLAFSFSAYAQEAVEVVGKAIEGTFPVQIDGKELDKEAIVVEGSSYLPVRKLAEAVGYEVEFDQETGIKLAKKSHYTVEFIEDEIKYQQGIISKWTTELENYKNNPVKPQTEEEKKEYERVIGVCQDLIDKAKAEIERLEKEKAKLIEQEKAKQAEQEQAPVK